MLTQIELDATLDALALAQTVSHATADGAQAPREAGSDERYVTRGLLGRGGMGEVRLALDTRLGREVAVKVARSLESSTSLRRFLREALVQGRLEHPAFVPVYDLAVDAEGAPYFTMRRVRGRTLRAVLDELAAGGAPREGSRFRLTSALVQLCLAVDYAHSRGVVHRDLKPENVMLGDFGELYLLDWGIAKIQGEGDEELGPALSGEGNITREGALLGTPGYMAPEQVRGEHGTIDARADVYSLGAILFETLTLEPMNPGATLPAVLSHTLTGEGRSPIARAGSTREVPPELDALCLAATEPEREKRIATARALAERLERYLEGERDKNAREQRAAQLSQQARAMLSAAGDDAAGSSLDRRVDAGRVAAQALALDPRHGDARELLIEALTAPPGRVPDEVEREVEQERQRSEAASWGVVAKGSVVFKLLLLALIYSAGVRQPVVMVAATGAGLAGTALLALAAKRGPRAQTLAFWGFALQVLENALFTRWSSPFIATPLLFVMLVLGLSNYALPRQRAVHIALGAAGITIPFALEKLGVLAPTFVVERGTVVITPAMAPMPGWIPWLLLAHTLLSLGALIDLFRTGDQLRETSRAQKTSAWLLRRVLTAA